MEGINQLSDALEKLKETGILDELPEEYQEHADTAQGILDQLKKDAALLKQIKDTAGMDWSNPTQEMVSSAMAVSGKVIDRLRSLPFLEDIPEYQEALDVAQKCLDGLTVFAKTAFELHGLALALKAAQTNPAAAVQAAWAGPGIAKQGIDFVRWLDPNLDTTQAQKDIENNVFGTLGAATGGGAAAGATIGALGGPVGIAIGGALGGAFGSIIGAIKIATE